MQDCPHKDFYRFTTVTVTYVLVPYPYTFANNLLNLMFLETPDLTKFRASLLPANIYKIAGERVMLRIANIYTTVVSLSEAVPHSSD